MKRKMPSTGLADKAIIPTIQLFSPTLSAIGIISFGVYRQDSAIYRLIPMFALLTVAYRLMRR